MPTYLSIGWHVWEMVGHYLAMLTGKYALKRVPTQLGLVT